MHARRLTALDEWLTGFDQVLRQACGIRAGNAHARAYPAAKLPADPLDSAKRELAGRLMRVNHAGEVAAQALYQGQGWTSRKPELRHSMAQSAREESDHLAWCKTRLNELGAKPSRLDPLWYLGSLAIGTGAGLLGDRFSLGFLAETERQVVEHLQGHLDRLPQEDQRSRAVIEQMQQDEAQHGAAARRAGGGDLPAPVRAWMRLASKVMTTVSYWI